MSAARNVRRFIRKLMGDTRRIESAGAGRAAGITPAGPINTEIMAAGSTVRRRARGAYLNNPLIRNAVENWIAECVRSGVMAKPKLPYLIPFWKAWCRFADHAGITNFDGLTAQVLRSVIVEGEAFIQIITTPDGPRLVLLQAEQVAEDLTMNLPDGGYIVMGIEFNANGQRVTYHVRPYDPTQIYPTWSQPIRIDAADIMHVFQPLMPGQVRGLSWLASALLSATELDSALDALIVAAKVAAMHCVILTDPNGDGSDPYASTPEPMTPGSVIRAPLGMDVKVSSPQQFNSAPPLLRQIVLQLAAALGVPEHYVNGDLSNANYSSLRAGMIPFRARVEQFQYTILTPQFLDRVWDRFIAEGVMSGRIDAPDYESNPENYATDWIFPAWQQIDPLKSTQADAAEVAAGFASRSQKVAERGWDVEEVDAQRAADAARETVPSVDPFETAAAQQQEENGNG